MSEYCRMIPFGSATSIWAPGSTSVRGAPSGRANSYVLTSRAAYRMAIRRAWKVGSAAVAVTVIANTRILVQRLAITHPPLVRLRHHGDQLWQRDPRAPAKFRRCLVRAAHQRIDLGRTIMAGVDLDDGLPRLGIQADLLRPDAAPLERKAKVRSGKLDELAHACRVTGRQDIVGRLGGLQDAPDSFDVFAGESPIAPGVEISERQR